MRPNKFGVQWLAISAVVGALYVALSMVIPGLVAGPIQFRASEALTLLPVCFPQAIPGLAVGCLITNMLFGYGIWDMVFGTLATLVAALLTRRTRNNLLVAAAWPVLVNAVVIGTMLHLIEGVPLLFTMMTVGVGQLGACYALGIPLVKVMRRIPVLAGEN